MGFLLLAVVGSRDGPATEVRSLKLGCRFVPAENRLEAVPTSQKMDILNALKSFG